MEEGVDGMTPIQMASVPLGIRRRDVIGVA
jgi:superfamily II DNA/RNA helicase